MRVDECKGKPISKGENLSSLSNAYLSLLNQYEECYPVHNYRNVVQRGRRFYNQFFSKERISIFNFVRLCLDPDLLIPVIVGDAAAGAAAAGSYPGGQRGAYDVVRVGFREGDDKGKIVRRPGFSVAKAGLRVRFHDCATIGGGGISPGC